MLIYTSKKLFGAAITKHLSSVKKTGIIKSLLNCKGGMSVLYLNLTTTIILGAVVFPWMADNGLYATRIMHLKSTMRTSINAAVQEIDHENSVAGLSKGFNEATGMLQVSEVTFNEELCKKVFFEMLESASGISENKIRDYLTIVLVQPKAAGIEYIIYRGAAREAGIVTAPIEIEETVNNYLGYGEIDSKYTIYVYGNNKTNEFENRPYIMTILKDFEIGGLLSKRSYTFIGFKAARISRRQ